MKSDTRVLAVALRSTGLAVALFVGDELMVARVSRTVARGGLDDARAVLAGWIKRFRPEVVVLEHHRHAVRKGKRQRRTLRYLPYAARRFPVVLRVVKRHQCYANKFEEAVALAKRFPILADRIPRKPRIWEGEPHFVALFEAVALGVSALDDPLISKNDRA